MKQPLANRLPNSPCESLLSRHDMRSMGNPQPNRPTHLQRGLLSRPLDTLVFLLPLLIFYETTSLIRGKDRLIAFDLLQQFIALFGRAGMWAPALGVVVILLATHLASGESWSIRWRRVGWMYGEAAGLALPLLALSWVVPLASGPLGPLPLFDRVALGIGAGIYEELVFRLMAISLMVMAGVDLLRLNRTGVAVAAILLSSLAFAAHHHPPLGMEPFDLTSFGFRTMAGMYLALIFWYRGYGPAAGCHAAYNIGLACLVSCFTSSTTI